MSCLLNTAEFGLEHTQFCVLLAPKFCTTVETECLNWRKLFRLSLCLATQISNTGLVNSVHNRNRECANTKRNPARSYIIKSVSI